MSSPHHMLEGGVLLHGEPVPFLQTDPCVVPASGEIKLGTGKTSVYSQYKLFLQKWCTGSGWDGLNFHVGQSLVCI